MKSIFRTLLAITFSLLLVMTPSVAVFADDDSALDNNQPAKTQEVKKGSDDLKGGSEKSDTNDDESSSGSGASSNENGTNSIGLNPDGDGDNNQNLDNNNDPDDNDHDIKPESDGDDPDLDDDNDDMNLGSDEDGEGEDNGDDTDDDEGVVPAVPAPVVKPVTVTITDFGNSFLFEADDNGTVRISGLFITYDYGASGSESFVMIVGGYAYPITIHSTGKVYGRLPKGFSIKNGELIIKGVNADMDILFVDHTMVSGISETPDEDGSYYEPSETSNKNRHRSSGRTSVSYTNTVIAASSPEATSASTTVESNEVTPPANGSAENEQVLDAFEEVDEAKGITLPLATGIALSVGAVSGLGVLLKLKLFAAL